MTLGEFIRQYREQHKMSIRSFASMVGMSVQQICNIERGTGSNGKPMVSSTMKTYQQIADGIGMSETDLLNYLNDTVRVNPIEGEKNMPIVEIDGHMMLDLTQLSSWQRKAINLLLQADHSSLPAALHEIELRISPQPAPDDPQ